MDHGVGIEVGDSRIVFLAKGRFALRTPADHKIISPCPELVGLAAVEALCGVMLVTVLLVPEASEK